MKYSSQRGTRDILPEEAPIWQGIEKTCRKLFSLYNYHEIRTPIFEATELFFRSIGQETDIVSKEMYTFLDKGGRSLTLRPEATAPVVRAAIQNNLIQKDKITKLYYIGPMFRYERPQAGRFRQFYQAGVEAFGSDDPALDAEIIVLATQVMAKLGIEDVEVSINSVGCSKCREIFIIRLKSYFSTHIDEMCEDCIKRFERNPLRILDCKEKQCQKFIEEAPAISDVLCPECRDLFEKILDYLKGLEVAYKINKKLVRGLDYYTGLTFEITSSKLGAQNALCGGGRYNNLVEEFGGAKTPAVGFAFGLDRIVEIIKSQPKTSNPKDGKFIYIAALGEEAKKIGASLLLQIRKAGKISDIDYLGKSLKSQLKEADRINASHVLIMGDEEIKSGNMILRDMKKASQETITCDKVLERLEVL